MQPDWIKRERCCVSFRNERANIEGERSFRKNGTRCPIVVPRIADIARNETSSRDLVSKSSKQNDVTKRTGTRECTRGRRSLAWLLRVTTSRYRKFRLAETRDATGFSSEQRNVRFNIDRHRENGWKMRANEPCNRLFGVAVTWRGKILRMPLSKDWKRLKFHDNFGAWLTFLGSPCETGESPPSPFPVFVAGASSTAEQARVGREFRR